MAALGPISPITSCMHEDEDEANKRVTRRTYALALPAVGWVGGGQGTHLVGADGDVGAVHEGVALDEVVGGERVRGEGLAAGDDGVVRADVEAVAQAEEVVRRRCHSVRPFQGMHWRLAGIRENDGSRPPVPRSRARPSWEDGGPDLVSSGLGCLFNVRVSRFTSGGDGLCSLVVLYPDLASFFWEFNVKTAL